MHYDKTLITIEIFNALDMFVGVTFAGSQFLKT